MLREKLASVIQQTRRHNKWTQEQTAERGDISNRYLRDVEHGEANITLDTLEKLCDGIGVNVAITFEVPSDV